MNLFARLSRPAIRALRATALAACVLSIAPCASVLAVTPIGMANPASKYCENRGGRVEMRRTSTGVAGWCHLPNGTVVDEWKLFRAGHPAMHRR